MPVIIVEDLVLVTTCVVVVGGLVVVTECVVVVEVGPVPPVQDGRHW